MPIFLKQYLTLSNILAEITTVVVDDDAKCNMLLDKAPMCLRKLIVIKDVRPATMQRARNRGVDILKFNEVEHLGAQRSHPEQVSILEQIFNYKFRHFASSSYARRIEKKNAIKLSLG